MRITESLQCPFCQNDNPALIEQTNHLRTQMDCYCEVCARSWVHKFDTIPKEDIIPKDNWNEQKRTA